MKFAGCSVVNYQGNVPSIPPPSVPIVTRSESSETIYLDWTLVHLCLTNRFLFVAAYMIVLLTTCHCTSELPLQFHTRYPAPFTPLIAIFTPFISPFTPLIAPFTPVNAL